MTDRPLVDQAPLHRLTPGVVLLGHEMRGDADQYPWECLWCHQRWEALPSLDERRGCTNAPWWA